MMTEALSEYSEEWIKIMCELQVKNAGWPWVLPDFTSNHLVTQKWLDKPHLLATQIHL